MYQESQEKVFSDVEKHEFSRISKIFEYRITNKALIFLMFFGFMLMFLFVIQNIQIFLKTKNTYYPNSQRQVTKEIQYSIQFKKIYELNTINNYPKFDDYLAKGIIIYDINTNQYIFEKNSDEQYLIASLTKLASIKILKDNLNENSVSTIPAEARNYNGSVLELKAGEVYTNRDLYKSAIIASNNQAIYALQEKETTVKQLNDYAKMLNLQKTIFRNPAGFDDDGGNFSTVKEMVPMAMIFFEDKELKDFAGTNKSEITEVNSNKTTLLVNTNELLKNDNYPVIAGKTGTTFRAGQNLVLLIEKNGRRYLIVFVASTDRYNDAIKILSRI